MKSTPGTDGVQPVQIYGSFHLGQTEFAIPAGDLSEVVIYPASITQMPLSPAHVLGLFNLRGVLIPVVDLRRLLRLEGGVELCNCRIAIVEHSNARVGLLFDATGEVLRVPAGQTVAMGESGSFITGVLKLDGGERLLQILSVPALPGFPELARMSDRSSLTQGRTQRAPREQSVSFRVADVYLALPMAAIHEIIRLPSLHPSPLGGDACIGMLNLRGKIVPIIDFGRFVGVQACGAPVSEESAADERRIIVFKHEDAQFGMLVDEVCSILAYRNDELLPMPAYAQRQGGLFAACITNGDHENVILVDPVALRADARIVALAVGHRDLYRNRAPTDDRKRGATRGVRETYVTFRLGHVYGAPIGQLREVMDYPRALVRAPGLPSHALGVLNLRGGLVTVINLRALYELDGGPDLTSTKVLVVEHRNEKFGLVVDSLDDIVTIDSADRMPIPSIVMSKVGTGMRTGLKGAVDLPGRGTAMLLDLVALCDQIASELVA